MGDTNKGDVVGGGRGVASARARETVRAKNVWVEELEREQIKNLTSGTS